MEGTQPIDLSEPFQTSKPALDAVVPNDRFVTPQAAEGPHGIVAYRALQHAKNFAATSGGKLGGTRAHMYALVTSASVLLAGCGQPATPKKVGPAGKNDIGLEQKEAKIFSLKDVQDIFDDTERHHDMFEKKMGRTMTPPEHVNKSHLESFVDASGKKVHILHDHHLDRLALKRMREALADCEGMPAHQILINGEGMNKPGVLAPQGTPYAVAEELKKRFGIPIVNTVRNVVDPSVVAEIFKRLEGQKPAIKREDVHGFFLFMIAMRAQRTSRDIPEAVEHLRSHWKEKGPLTVEELYAAVESVYDVDAQVARKMEQRVGKLVDAVADELKVDTLDTRRPEIVKRLLDAAKKPQSGTNITEVIGTLLIHDAQRVANGFSDFPAAMRKLQKTWGKELADIGQLHTSLMQYKKYSFKEAKAVNLRVGALARGIQDQRTTADTRTMLQEHPNTRVIINIAGYEHAGSIANAYEKKKQ